MIHRLGRPALLVLVSVWTACGSLLIRRPIWTLSSDAGLRAYRLRRHCMKARKLPIEPLIKSPRQAALVQRAFRRFTFRAALRSLWNFPLSEYRDAVKRRSDRTAHSGGESGKRYRFSPHDPTHICDISSDRPPKVPEPYGGIGSYQ
jgi:hypothetical protein